MATHINELLCYVTYSLRANNNHFLENIVKSKFDIDDIKKGKKLLWQLCGEQLGQHPNRLSSENREAKDAHLEDILVALGKLDALNKLPVFVAADLGKLPGIQPEELNQLYYINRVASLEKQVKQHRFKSSSS